MLGLSVAMTVACLAVVYVGAVVQASFGIGVGMIASPVLALADPDFIPAAIVISVLPLTFTVAWADRAHVERRGVGLALIGRVPGVVLGAVVAASISDELLAGLVAGSVLLAVAVSLTTRRFRPTDTALVVAGLASGFTGTTTGVGGPPMALTYQHHDPVTMRSSISAFFAVGSLLSIIALALAGEVGTRQLQLGALLVPPVMLGVATSRVVQGRIDPARVRPIVLVICAAAATLLLVETFVVDGDDGDEALVTPAATCMGAADAAALTELFNQEPGGMMAADYQRAVPLPDGRTLWLFQDATVRLPPPPALPTTTTPPPGVPPPPPPETERLLHNAALLQTGTCFELLRSGTEADPKPWLFAAQTVPFGHWFWPLDATIGEDGRLYVFMAEMIERGPLYLSASEPVSVRLVGLDLPSLRVGYLGQPANDSPSLYGFSIATDADWTYLYSHCHRQFGWDSLGGGRYGHDFSCSANVSVARVRRGRVLDPPQYWDGQRWQGDPNRAVAVIPTTGREINPTQVRFTGEEFVAVTKEGDWFGTTIFLDRAPRAEGPWSTYARLPARPKCAPLTCNTYFASWVPWNDGSGEFLVGLSHNRWDGRLSTINRPTFFTVPRPGTYPFAARCSLVEC